MLYSIAYSPENIDDDGYGKTSDDDCDDGWSEWWWRSGGGGEGGGGGGINDEKEDDDDDDDLWKWTTADNIPEESVAWKREKR